MEISPYCRVEGGTHRSLLVVVIEVQEPLTFHNRNRKDQQRSIDNRKKQHCQSIRIKESVKFVLKGKKDTSDCLKAQT